jgi:hypothetical protein
MPKLREHVTVRAEARRPLRGWTIPLALQSLSRAMPRLGPYVVLATVLPGGILLAPLLYLYRRHASADSRRDKAVRSRIERYMRSIVLRDDDL